MFKNKLQNEVDNYQIKTTANDILKKYHEVNPPIKKSNNIWKPILAFSLSFATIGTLVILFNNDSINNNSNNSSSININKKYANIISLEVASSLDLIENYNSPLLTTLRKNNVDNDTFIDICTNFKNNFNTLNESLSYKNNYGYHIEIGEYKIDESIYTYKVAIEDFKYLYYSSNSKSNEKNIKETYDGVLIIDGTYYQMEGKRIVNTNNNEDEIDVNITINDSTTLNIEQETERSEYSYSYSLIENNEKIYELEIDFEKDEIEMECFNNQKEYEYEIQILNKSYLIEYQYSYLTIEIEGNMTLTIDENTNELTFEDKNNSLIFQIFQ